MCGIAGFIDLSGAATADAMGHTAAGMADSIRHRGPDDSGAWVDDAAGVALSHRRLSILDLSESGHQPMVSASGRSVIVFNGEVYNFAEVRAILEKDTGPVKWRGHSDTEILLEAVERWGVEKTLGLVNGMFAFALWDKVARTLALARDRMGKKPLYYGWNGGVFMFASELKAMRRHPAFAGKVSRGAVSLLLRHNYIPSPHSIYEGIYKIPPACLLTVDMPLAAGGPFSPYADADTAACPKRFWDLRGLMERGSRRPVNVTMDEAVDRLDEILRDATRLRTLADVPVGAFLSGGIDSATVVAIMQAQSQRPVKTFTIGAREKEHDEAHHAKAVAEALGTDHTELYVTPDQVMPVLEEMADICDEPISDAALANTYIVSGLARKEVTVCLTGDGGDEMFSGYPRYNTANWYYNQWQPKVDPIPNPARRALAAALKAVSKEAWDSIYSAVKPMIPKSRRWDSAGDKLHELARILPYVEPERFYGMIYHWGNADQIVIGAENLSTVISDPSQWLVSPDKVARMVYLDIASRLPDSILAKVDRVTMRTSLEARSPILDYRVMEFSASLPTELKIEGWTGKVVLRNLLYRYVPKGIVDRPKKGFSMPISQWLRGPLRDWAEDLLSEKRLREEGFFDPAPIRAKLAEHVTGKAQWHYQLWTALMFQAWLNGAK
ncbi:MAG: asparagine synthase (glutamine-hydrolyzing) [Nitrospinae bacterium]|nr:asparagine synthase (glutamine-hydrolyzing) [Nitrospinota bacterium]